MDSIYCSAPRPFNKYPRGYRPVNDDYSRQKLRPSSSWSSLTQAASGVDQRSGTLPHFPNTCGTPDYSSSWHEARRPFRTESSSTLFDNYSSNFSPRELSPLSTASEYCNNNNNPVNDSYPVQSVSHEMPRHTSTDQYTAYNSQQNTRMESDFLKNLQHQRDKVSSQKESDRYGYNNSHHSQTRNMSSSWYGQPYENGQRNERNWSPQKCAPPTELKPLTKTYSDMSFDTFSTPQNERALSPPSQKFDGFFRNRIIEPNWMNDPPPPKAFREEMLMRTNTLPTSNFEIFRIDPNYREKQSDPPALHRSPSVPINNLEMMRNNYQQPAGTARNYINQREMSPTISFKSPQNINQLAAMNQQNNIYEQRHMVHSPLHQQVKRGDQTFSSSHNSVERNDNRQTTGTYQNVPPNLTVYKKRERPNSYYSESDRRSAAFASDPIPLSHNRVLHIHPLANQEQYAAINEHTIDEEYRRQPAPHQQQHKQASYQRARIQSPLREYARLTSPLRETEVSIQRQDEPRVEKFCSPVDERIFSPVESKVFNRNTPTVINGFTSNRHTYNSHTDDVRNRRESSQPPVAVIEPNINNQLPIIERTKYQQNVMKPETVSYYNPTYVSSKPTELSPTSTTYDNESDLDIEEMARKVLPKYLKNVDARSKKTVGYGSDNLQGILIKTPSLHRSSSKKVVFLDQEKGSPQESSDAPAHVRAYDDAIEESLGKWGSLTDQIGGDIVEIKPKVLKVFDNVRNFLWKAAGMAEPSMEESQKMLKPIVDLINDINMFKDSKRNTPQFNHLSTLAEGLPGVGWVVIKKTPAPYIKEHIDASMFFVNRILKEYKEKDPKHVEWTKAWIGLFEDMQKFVRQTHTTGLVWNSAPGSAPSATSAPAAPAPPKGGPPLPPPPIPADLFFNVPAAAANTDKDKVNRDALFASINKGEGITSGLRKVTADMQTHKNPSLRGNTAAPPTKAGAPAAAPKAPVKKPAKKELQDGKQWNVEYFVNDQNITIDVTDKKQTIYVFRCENSVIKVNGKANSITLDGCKKTSIVFDALVAQCETINCQSVQIQTLGELPTLSIQKTDGCQVYLSKVSQGAEIITSKSSEMNILVQLEEDGDYVEFPVPEQFKTTFVNGKLVTTVSDIV